MLLNLKRRTVMTTMVLVSCWARLPAHAEDPRERATEGDTATTQQLMSAESISYDIHAAKWLFDPERIVGRNDVLYTGPSTADWHDMPAGGGDLWTLVRSDGGLHLRLFKSDNWTGTLGTVHIDFGARGRKLASQRFSQRLDLYRGRVVVHLGENPTGPHIEVWGHPTHRIIVVTVSDPATLLDPARVTYTSPRDTVAVGITQTTLWAKEIEINPAGPALVNTGMQDYFLPGHDPRLGRGTAVVIGQPGNTPVETESLDRTAVMTLPPHQAGTYQFIISASVTQSGDPLVVAQRQLQDACSTPLATLEQQQQDWWREYWDQSFLCLESFDQQADWLCAAYHVHLYTLGCLNRGEYPPNYAGGGPILDWIQEVRFVFSPLYAANRLDMARLLPDTFSRMRPYLRAQTRKVWDVEGLWVPECYYPWGHTDDIVLKDDGRDLSWLWHRRDPAKIPYGMFELYNNHTGLIFTTGPEICHHFLTFFRYSGDQEFLRSQAYPFIRDVCEFMANILRQEADGLYHLDPANALETWWLVRDPADTLDAIRYLFPEFIRLSEVYGLDATLRSRCQSILASLPEASVGKWHDDGRVDDSVDAYAPAAGKHDHPRRVNAENPALYRVYPFGLSGIGTSDFDRAKRTFECRTSPLWFGWSMDAIWAARLGLRDEACSLLVEHARRFNVFPYGGWHFNAHACHDKPFPHNRDLYTKPFLDAGGCSATALQEILLQSHGGMIRVAPALSGKWSGIFQLRANGGFLVAADIRQGQPQIVEIRSLLGQRCVIANPWPQSCRVRNQGDVLLEASGEEISFDTDVGAIYTLERTDQPVANIPACSLEQREAFWRARGYRHSGLPGRDG